MNDNNNPFAESNTSGTYDLFDRPAAEDTGNIVNPFDMPDRAAINEQLTKAKAAKLDALSNRNDGANLSNSYTQLADGRVESNSNKLWNDTSDQGAQSLEHLILNTQTLDKDENGNHFFKDGTPYEGSVRRLYYGGTKIDENEVEKLGVSRGDKPDSTYRYDAEKGGWVSGKAGIDHNNFKYDVLVPYGVGTMFEAVMHGRTNSLKGRTVPDVFDDPFSAEQYGSGKSEYYNSREALYGPPAEIDEALGKKIFDEQMARMPASHLEYVPRKSALFSKLMGDTTPVDSIDTTSDRFKKIKAEGIRHRLENQTVFGELAQTFSALPAGIAKGAIELADAGLEAATFLPQLAVRMASGDDNYDIDLFNDGVKESIIEAVDSTVGYDRELDEAVMDSAYKEIVAAGIDVTSIDSIIEGFNDPEKRKHLGAAALTFLSDPSLTMSMITEIFGSGLGLGAATKVGAKVANKFGGKAVENLSKVFESNLDKIKAATEVAVKAGDKVALKQLSESYTIGKKTGDLLRGNVFTNADMAVRMNKDITAFKSNNDGNLPDNQKLLEMAALNRAVSIAEVISLKSLAGIKNAPAEVVKKVVKEGVVKAAGKVVGKMLKGGLQEGLQETVDSIVEQLNQKMDSADWEGKTVQQVLSAASAEILTGTIAGAMSGVQLSGVGSLGPAIGAGSKFTADKTKGILADKSPVVETPTNVPTETEVVTAKSTYGKLLKRVATYTSENEVNEKNIGMLLEDLDELNNTKHVIGTSDPQQVANGEAIYSGVADKLKSFIDKNPSLKLTKRMVRKTVKESKADSIAKATAEQVAAIPDETKAAFSELSRVMGAGDDKDATTSVNKVIAAFNKGDYKSVVVEEGTIDKELQGLELALTGKVSEGIQETFDNIQVNLRGKNLKTLAPKKVKEVTEEAPTGTVLGSGPASDVNTNTEEESEFEELDYDDYTRSVDAERIIRTVLGSGKDIDKKFRDKAAVFGTTNGMSRQSVVEVIKSYESVNDEATSGNRGYLSRLSRLRGLTESSKPNQKAIDKEFKGLTDMHASISKSEIDLSRGIKAAKAEAASMNKYTTFRKPTKQFKTDYMKYNQKTKAYDDPYNINIQKVDGKWTALVEHAESLLSTKKGYTTAITKGIAQIDKRTISKSGTSTLAAGKVAIPVKENKSKAARQKDVNYINAVTEILDEVIPNNNGVTKVILGQSTHSKWKINSDYRKANLTIINNEEFDADDVVLIDSTEVSNQKGGKYSHMFGEDAAASVKAAAAVGATFVLDSDMTIKEKGRTTKEYNSILGFFARLEKAGYVRLEGSDKVMFIKETVENKKLVRDRVAKLKAEKASTKVKADNKSRIVSLNRSLEEELDIETGKDFEGNRFNEVAKEFGELVKVVEAESFGGSKDKLRSFLERETVDSVVKEATAILNDPEATPLNYDDKVFEKAVADYIAKEESKDVKGAEVLKAWKDIAEKGLNTKDREAGVSKIVKSIGQKTKGLIDSILGERSFAKGKLDMYETIYQSISTGEVYATPVRKDLIDAEYAARVAKNDTLQKDTKYGQKVLFIGTRRIVQDATKLVNVTRTTVVNSIPLEYLPFSMRNAVEKFTADTKSALAKVSDAELAEQTNGKGPDGFNLHNSPARGLFFNNEGKVNEEVMTALYLSVGEMLTKDKASMSRGFKSDFDVAKMFGVQETEITYDMKNFAREHGGLLKTASNSLGKSILAQLGITKRKDSDTSDNEYESFISDVGNTALLIAEEQKLISNTSVSSNDMAKMYKDGEEHGIETTTHFVHISDVPVKKGKFTSNTADAKVEAFSKAFTEAVEGMPEASTTVKAPYFVRPDEARLDKAKDVVRNDISGKQVPEEGKQTLEILMDTAYRPEMERIDELLDAVDNDEYNVKKLLGAVDLESAEFEKMYYRDKEVQEAKNAAIDKTIDELRALKARIANQEGDAVDLYFDYFYASNDRYMMDSNTINPQVDKIHRFLITPRGHKLDYTIKVNDVGGLLFEVESGVDEDKDQSFTVRMAIAQALGKGIDKMFAEDIIDFGDAMLSMSSTQIEAARKEILTHGKFEFVADGVTYKGEAEHLTHALQALNFLDNVVVGLMSGRKMTSSLSLEFDSLTSGFANKTQQMPILSDMDEHFARTGVLTMAYQRTLMEAASYRGEGTAFKPNSGVSMADVIASGDGHSEGFLDSYKTMAKTTILKLRDNEKQKAGLSHAAKEGKISGFEVFSILKPLLPGGESIDSSNAAIDITSAIRNLFKNPFMIFNYSAGISRIIRNLGNNVAHDLAKNIGTADLSLPKNAGVKAVAQDLLDTVKMEYLIDKDGTATKTIKTLADLQEALSNKKLSAIKLKVPFVVEAKDPSKKGKQKPAANLEAMLETVVKATYGAAVKEVFEESFKPFIEVQDAMNDTYKVAFRVFDKKRVDMLKELQQSKEGKFLTVKDHATVLESLWDDFPWIVGPLSGADNKKAVISVVTTSTRSPSVIEQSRKKPQALRNAKKSSKSRKVTPLVKYLEEAVSSGSVLPFHAIDGAQIAKTFIATNFATGNKDMAAIHDAIIPPLNMSDAVGFNYQKSMADINSQYVLVDSIADLIKRLEPTIKGTEFTKEFNEVSVKGLKTLGENKEGLDFPAAIKVITGSMSHLIGKVNKEREYWYGVKNSKGEYVGGKLEGAYYGNLVGTPGGMYRTAYTDENGVRHPATTAPDLSYKTEFTNKYRNNGGELNISETVTKPPVDLVQVEEFTADRGLLDILKKELVPAQTPSEMAAELSADPSKAAGIIRDLSIRLRNMKTDKTIKAVEELIDKLSFFTVPVEPNETVEGMTAEISGEINDVVGMLGLLGVKLKTTSQRVPTASEVMELQGKIIAQITKSRSSKGALSTATLNKIFSSADWVFAGNNAATIAHIKERTERGTAKMSERMHKAGIKSEREYLAFQVVEELNEVVEATITDKESNVKLLLDAQKSVQKVIRFGAGTVVKGTSNTNADNVVTAMRKANVEGVPILKDLGTATTVLKELNRIITGRVKIDEKAASNDVIVDENTSIKDARFITANTTETKTKDCK